MLHDSIEKLAQPNNNIGEFSSSVCVFVEAINNDIFASLNCWVLRVNARYWSLLYTLLKAKQKPNERNANIGLVSLRVLSKCKQMHLAVMRLNASILWQKRL